MKTLTLIKLIVDELLIRTISETTQRTRLYKLSILALKGTSSRKYRAFKQTQLERVYRNCFATAPQKITLQTLSVVYQLAPPHGAAQSQTIQDLMAINQDILHHHSSRKTLSADIAIGVIKFYIKLIGPHQLLLAILLLAKNEVLLRWYNRVKLHHR